MIEQMTKYSFILLNQEQEGFMERIRKFGVIDVTRSVKPVDEKSAEMLSRSDARKKALTVLSNVDFSKDGDSEKIMKSSLEHKEKVQNPVEAVFEAQAKLEALKGELQSARKDYAERLPWGNFDKKKIQTLSEQGLFLHFYKVTKKQFDPKWKEKFALQIIAESSTDIRFVTVTQSADYIFPINECPAPGESADVTAEKIETLKKETIRAKGRLQFLKSYKSQIEQSLSRSLSDLDFYLANACCPTAAENHISVVTGFAPTKDETRLCSEFDKMDVFYIKEAAVKQDNPPIKLKNNKYTKMFSVLTDMYGLPDYDEFDPTPFLSIFFLMFFGICLGDAGYGLLLVVIGFMLRKVKSFSSMAPLVSTLGIATFFIGIVLHTFFGMDLYTATWVPEWLKKCMISGKIFGYDAQMISSIFIGIFHLSLAIITKSVYATKQKGFANSLGTWGWTLLIVGSVIVGGLSLLGVMSSSVTKIVIITIGGISAIGIFLLNDMHRNPLANIGVGLWDTYNTATGLLGDTLSYLRLYALGLAGGMLGNAFNQLAKMLLGDGSGAGAWIGFILILLLGHTLNLAMSCLGAFVHPLRLNFLEFFKNSGYNGQGRGYMPLHKVQQDTIQ